MKFDQNGLIPAIIQDHDSQIVLMMGYMNQEAFDRTINTGRVTFFSRSRKRLWTKGETSENYLKLIEWSLDCDNDTLLIKAEPAGPTCHTGSDTCWNEINQPPGLQFLNKLSRIIKDRKESPSDQSYTSSLFVKGAEKIAQKVGEEATELVIEAMKSDDDLFLEEAADLLYHYMVLLASRNMSLQDVTSVLNSRHS